jgi:hypothetical protein
LLREVVATEGNVVHDIDSNNKWVLAWKVQEVKLTTSANHSNAYKDRHGSVVKVGQISKNSYG